MGSDDAAYFASRAEAERALAERAAHPNAVEAHRRLAASASNRLLSTLRTRMRGFFSPIAMIRWTSGGIVWVMSSS